MDGTILADVHVAMVDSTWYMWLSVDPLADKRSGLTRQEIVDATNLSNGGGLTRMLKELTSAISSPAKSETGRVGMIMLRHGFCGAM